MAGWGLEEGVVWRLKEAILKAVQRTLPEVELVAHEAEKERDEETTPMDDAESQMFEAALTKQAEEVWRGDDGREAREYVEGMGTVRKLRWARLVLGRRAKGGGVAGANRSREMRRRDSEAADGRAMDRWTGRKAERRAPRWQRWWPSKAIAKRQTTLGFGMAQGARLVGEGAGAHGGAGNDVEGRCDALERAMCEVEEQRREREAEWGAPEVAEDELDEWDEAEMNRGRRRLGRRLRGGARVGRARLGRRKGGRRRPLRGRRSGCGRAARR